MKVYKTALTETVEETTPEAFVKQVIDDEGDYFLDYNDQAMYDEFYSIAYYWVPETSELDNNKEELKKALIAVRDQINKDNYDKCVQAAADFMRDAYVQDYCDDCDYPVYGEAKGKVFADAITLLYNQYCSEKEIE